MSIFSKIKSAIFGSPAQAAPAAAPTTSTTAPTQAATASPAAPSAASAAPAPASSAAPSSASSSPAQPAGSTPAQNVDVAAILDEAVKKNGQKLDWRRSIVDLMKALGMDASLTERKELADELGYTGDKNDSATMNMWLHKALLKKLSDNGGKVPADLLD
ncbi:DUF3597 domain-containing protein [Rhizobium sp. NTR19]|uniref:DUF3597 domain-containing protein n=1 Tax=Neorhizobium turbinariae TaxID=2937795 RepID=A0ABT0INF5_9HYPH|nr:DUF3597 domain-containing protein [Neorhizobium turbinariae]MCK8779392.1 DUF3597 domain-containing protein [Neorhizobium turbinariae]